MQFIQTIVVIVSSVQLATARVQVPYFGQDIVEVSSEISTPLQFLTSTSTAPVADIISEFVNARSPPASDGFGYVVKDQITSNHSQITHVYLKQTFQGTEISNGDMNINIDRFGRVISFGSSFFHVDNAASSVDHIPAFKLANGAESKDQLFFSADSEAVSPAQAVHKFAVFLGMESGLNGAMTESLASSDEAEVLTRGDEPVFKVMGVPFAADNSVVMVLRYMITSAGRIVPAWQLSVDMVEGDNWFNAHLHMTTGTLLEVIDWVQQATFRAYPLGVNDPNDGQRVLLVNPEDARASPLGWNTQSNTKKGDEGHFTTTKGNNVYAQANPHGRGKWENNFRPEGNGTRSSLTFDFPIDFTKDPDSYLSAAIVNLFVWNNYMHDIFLHYGFDEKSGNFQEDNFGNGGRGNDAVIANAQDGSGFNNANFATPPDGRKPRMRMYTWKLTSPFRDGDLESGIIVHEYGHGISTRLTGGPANSNCLGRGEAGGMGEGWGDFWGTLLRMRPSYNSSMNFPMGVYSAGRGIRAYPYSTDMTVNPHTYGFLKRKDYKEVHAQGAVWATILYDIYWLFVEAHGFNPNWYAISKLPQDKQAGNHIINQLVVDGLKLQPCRPNFVSARNAILQADESVYEGKHICLLWKGFAKRGLGVGAKKGGHETFEVPAECM